MKFIWIIFIIIAIEEMICNDILKNKKQLVVYSCIVVLSIVLCVSYYSNEYTKSIIGVINEKIDLERFIWINLETK